MTEGFLKPIRMIPLTWSINLSKFIIISDICHAEDPLYIELQDVKIVDIQDWDRPLYALHIVHRLRDFLLTSNIYHQK